MSRARGKQALKEHHIALHVTPEPAEGTRTVLNKPGEGTLIMRSEAAPRVVMDCGSCGARLTQGVPKRPRRADHRTDANLPTMAIASVRHSRKSLIRVSSLPGSPKAVVRLTLTAIRTSAPGDTISPAGFIPTTGRAL
jgi:hypothetical protein